jgi:hypothetical protein
VVVGSVVVGSVLVGGGQRGRGRCRGGRRGRRSWGGHRGWVTVAPTVESGSVTVVLPAVAGAWALAGPGVVVGLLTASGTMSEVGAKRVGAGVDSRGPVVEVDTGLVAGSAWTSGSTRADTRRSGDGWGHRVAEATRAARTPVVSPKATSPSLQGHGDTARCRGPGHISCREPVVDMVHCPSWTSPQAYPELKAHPAHPDERCRVLSRYALRGAFDKENAIKASTLGEPCPGIPAHGIPPWMPRAGRLMVALDSLGTVLARHPGR